MKKIKKNNLFFIAAIGLFFLTSYAFAEDCETSISKIQGQATLIQDGQSRPAQEGDKLKTGDVVKTSADGTVDFTMGSLAGCRVLPDTECKISDAKKTDMVVKLEKGWALFNMKKLPEDTAFRVETPTAIASVRGTQFSGRVDTSILKDPKSTFTVRESTIAVSKLTNGVPQGTPIIIQEGFSCDITLTEIQALARPATGQELAVIEQVPLVTAC
jgi:hypothetical protein